MLKVTEAWRKTFPGATVGLIAVRGLSNPPSDLVLEERKKEVERDLRSRYKSLDKAALNQMPVLQAYDAYYRRFKKTYHVLLQLDSILNKGKSIPSVAALVECMFMSELKNMLLTAGHDLDALQGSLFLDVSTGTETYTLMRGEEQTLKPEDMMISDHQGVISSILYGPDYRTRITPQTQSALFTVYAPAGIDAEAVQLHLTDLLENIKVISPDVHLELLQTWTA
jgi:DNA/RNA-binding domain of Phe-tRNA-synthetase-like protein